MKKAKDRILSDIIHLASSNFFRHFLALFTSFIRPKWLSPEHFGIWGLLSTIPNYMAYFDFGMRNSMRYAIPKHRDDPERLALIQGTTFWTVFTLVSIICLSVIIYSFNINLKEETRISLYIVIASVLLGIYFEQRFNEMRGYQEFKLISKMVYLRYTISSFLTVALIYYWGIYGAFAAITISLIASNIFMACHGTRVAYTRFSWKQIRPSIKFGFPIMMMGLTEIFLRMVDKWLIAFFLGTEELGYYALGAMILGPLLNIPGVSRDVTESLLMKEKSSSAEAKSQIVKNYLATPLLQTSTLTMPILIGIALFAIPPFITLFLSEYVKGIQAIQILLLGSFFLASTFPVRGIIIANNWQSRAAAINCIPIVFSLALNGYLLKSGYGIEAVAMGTSAAFVLLSFLLISFVLIRLRYYLKYSWLKLCLSLLCYPIACAFFFVIEYHLPINQYTHWAIEGINYDLDLLFDQIIKCLIFLICYIPIPLILWKKGAFVILKD